VFNVPAKVKAKAGGRVLWLNIPNRCALFTCALPVLALAACSYDRTSGPDGRDSSARYIIGKPYEVAGRWYTPREDFKYSRVGLASVAGKALEGRKTRSGDRYDAAALTAAHPTLPMPSYVRVTNIDNDRSVVVRINDRGPFKPGHIIELSQAAANKLRIYGPAGSRVRVTIVPSRSLAAKREILGDRQSATRYRASASTFDIRRSVAERSGDGDRALRYRSGSKQTSVRRQGPEGIDDRASRLARIDTAAGAGRVGRPTELRRSERAAVGRYWIQVGSFTQRANARTASADLRDIAKPRVAALRVHGTRYYRVRVGPFRSRDAARRALARIRGMDYPDAKIIVK